MGGAVRAAAGNDRATIAVLYRRAAETSAK